MFTRMAQMYGRTLVILMKTGPPALLVTSVEVKSSGITLNHYFIAGFLYLLSFENDEYCSFSVEFHCSISFA